MLIALIALVFDHFLFSSSHRVVDSFSIHSNTKWAWPCFSSKVHIPAGNLIGWFISFTWIFIKVGYIHVTFNWPLQWCSHRTFRQFIPMECIKPSRLWIGQFASFWLFSHFPRQKQQQLHPTSIVMLTCAFWCQQRHSFDNPIVRWAFVGTNLLSNAVHFLVFYGTIERHQCHVVWDYMFSYGLYHGMVVCRQVTHEWIHPMPSNQQLDHGLCWW